MLQLVADLTLAAWIDAGKKPVEDASQGGVRLENLVPAVFPAYCKLFHPIYVDPEVSDRSTSWHQAESQGRPDLGVLAGGTLVRESSDGRVKGERVRWRELAERYGLTFHSDLHAYSFARAFGKSWPRYLLGPDEGTLDDATCDALIAVLGPLTGAVPCYFYYSGISVIFSASEGYPAHLYQGSLFDVSALADLAAVSSTPEYWWPEDRSWCVHTDWDLAFTLIGGTERVVEAVLGHPELEAVRVSAGSRIDPQGDMVNLGTDGAE